MTENITQPILIETHGEDGIEWGVSFNGFNPEIEDYVGVKDVDTGIRLISILARLGAK